MSDPQAYKVCEHCRSSHYFGLVDKPDRMVVECTVCGTSFDVVRFGAAIPKPEPKLQTVMLTSPQGTPSGPGDFVLTFGKHKGETLDEVFESDPSYLDWILGADDMRPSVKKAVNDFIG